MIANRKRYIFASDFDQTLSFNDSGLVLAEMIGIAPHEFERRARGMAQLNLVQQGGELAYLLLHDPEFRSRVRRDMLFEVGRRVRLKPDIARLHDFLTQGIEGHQFDFYVLSAAPVEIVRSALDGVVPPSHIFGTEFEYNAHGYIDTIRCVTAGYGKVTVLDRLQQELLVSPDHIVYIGDGSSDVHVMLHVNRRDGFTIAVSENKYLAPIAKRSVISDNAFSVVIPILEDIVGWRASEIRSLFEAQGFQIQEWDKVQTDTLTIRPIEAEQIAEAGAD